MMNWFNGLLRKFVRWSGYAYLKTGIWGWWARVYNEYLDEDYTKKVILPVFENIDDVRNRLVQMKWTEDPIRGLLDTAYSPHRVEYMFQNDRRKRVGDCEDFARWICAVVKNSIAAGIWRGPVPVKSYVATCFWGLKNGIGFSGHAIALMRFKDPISGLHYWKTWDYGWPSKGYASPEEAIHAHNIRPGRELLFWGIFEPDTLKSIEIRKFT